MASFAGAVAGVDGGDDEGAGTFSPIPLPASTTPPANHPPSYSLLAPAPLDRLYFVSEDLDALGLC